jgi:hypothetical protein
MTTFLTKGYKMLTFAPHKGVEVYAGKTGYICFKQTDNYPDEDIIVMLTIGQFRAVLKNADELIADAEYNKTLYLQELQNETNS